MHIFCNAKLPRYLFPGFVLNPRSSCLLSLFMLRSCKLSDCKIYWAFLQVVTFASVVDIYIWVCSERARRDEWVVSGWELTRQRQRLSSTITVNHSQKELIMRRDLKSNSTYSTIFSNKISSFLTNHLSICVCSVSSRFFSSL
jgi:hypothetical protein